MEGVGGLSLQPLPSPLEGATQRTLLRTHCDFLDAANGVKEQLSLDTAAVDKCSSIPA